MTARKAPLRTVQPDEKAPERPKKRKSVTQAADDGTQRDLLVALRTRIAKQVEDPNCPPRDLAALSRRLLEIAKEIEAIDAAAEEEAAEGAGATPDEEWDEEAI